MTSIPFKI